MAKAKKGKFIRAFVQAFDSVKSFPLAERPQTTEIALLCFTKRIQQKCPLLGQDLFSDDACKSCVLLTQGG